MLRPVAVVMAMFLTAGCDASEGRAQRPARAVQSSTATLPTEGKTRGMNFAHAMRKGMGYGSPASLESLQELRALHVNAIAVTPFGFQRRADDVAILWTGSPARQGGHGIGETDEAMHRVIAQAHGLKLRVLLKPHLWLRPPGWPGSIHHDSDAQWAEWFAAYREFILHYAAMAEAEHVEMFCIGNELTIASKREREWRALIAEIRKVYRGPLTYGANLEEVFEVRFWDDLDAIGLSAYFPLSDQASPSRATIERGWQPIAERLGELSRRWKRRVLVTELGYSSRDYATEEPWAESGGPLNVKLQADAFAAFFQAVWPRPWCAGAYFWKWESYPNHADRGAIEFAFEHKPAEAVIRDAFAAQESSDRHAASDHPLTRSPTGVP